MGECGNLIAFGDFGGMVIAQYIVKYSKVGGMVKWWYLAKMYVSSVHFKLSSYKRVRNCNNKIINKLFLVLESIYCFYDINTTY